MFKNGELEIIVTGINPENEPDQEFYNDLVQHLKDGQTKP